MKKIWEKLLKSPLWQFVKFCIVGVANMFVNLAVYYLIIFIDLKLYLVANVAAWAISVLNAFYWNNRYVFREGKNDRKSVLFRLLRTYLAYGATVLLTTALLHFEVEVWGIGEAVAPLINIVICTPINFLLNKFWAFAIGNTERKYDRTDDNII